MPDQRLLVFLYKGDEPASATLLRRLIETGGQAGVTVWSDLCAESAAFSDGLREMLGLAGTIVHCVGPRGLGRYQSLNELDLTAQALDQDPQRRLVLVRLGREAMPPEFQRLAAYAARTVELALPEADPAPAQVLSAAFPAALPAPAGPLQAFAQDLLKYTLLDRTPRSLTLVIGPYAACESMDGVPSPARAIRRVLRTQNLPGFAPWLDVTGSIAASTAVNMEDVEQSIRDAFSGSQLQGGSLGLYLRMFAAKWRRFPGRERLFIVTCGPEDTWVADALGKSRTPVEYVSIVNRRHVAGGQDTTADSIVVRRHAVGGPAGEPAAFADPEAALPDSDRIVLVRPMGCLAEEGSAMLTAEHWRSSRNEMVLPEDLSRQMRRGVLVVLGAGAFSPSLQIVFQTLLRTPLGYGEANRLRFMVMHPDKRVNDPLHRIEAALARSQGMEHDNFEDWLGKEPYFLKLRKFPPFELLMQLDCALMAREAGVGSTG